MNEYSEFRRGLARRIALAHEPLGGGGWMALVSGSVVEDIADAQSDVDMAIVFDQLPGEAALRAACESTGALPWHWQSGDLAEGALVVAFKFEGIEAQIAYSNEATLLRDLDQVLVQHDPDTPQHKLAEGLGKAEPLAGEQRLRQLQARIAEFPLPLGRAMAVHFLGQPTLWRAVPQLLNRDAVLWCREMQVQSCYRLLGALCGLNGVYFTSFQLKRMHRLAGKLNNAPVHLAQRIETILTSPIEEAFSELHQLEAEVIDRVCQAWPDLDFSAARQRHAAYVPPPQRGS